MSKETFFTSQATDANSSSKSMQGSKATLFVWGGFGGGTVTFQISPDGSEWFDLADATFTAKGTVNIDVPNQVHIRASLSGATGATVSAMLID